jgi:predicted permease
MVNFLLIISCMTAGILFRRSKTLPNDAHKGLNAWLIYLAVPATSFKYLPYIEWKLDLLLPILSPILVWLGALLVVRLYSLKHATDPATLSVLRLSGGLSNTSFLGFPLIMAFFGERFLSIAIICDQVTFMLLSSVGIITCLRGSAQGDLSFKNIMKKLVMFPPFLGCVAALTIPHYINIAPIAPLFDKLAATVAPIALFSIGLQLKLGDWKNEITPLSMGLFYKLLVAPMLILGIVLILGMKGDIPKIAIFEAAMPALISSAVVAEVYGLNVRLATLLVGFGIIFSFFTATFWWFILTFVVKL